MPHEVVAVPLAGVFAPPQTIHSEARVFTKLSHNHILPFEDITEDFGSLPALVHLWMENGSLSNYLKQEFPQLSDPQKLELVSAWLSRCFIPLTRGFRYSKSLLVLVIVCPIVIDVATASCTEDCLVHRKPYRACWSDGGRSHVYMQIWLNSTNCWQTGSASCSSITELT
jgi:serine/threonine protein kinase